MYLNFGGGVALAALLLVTCLVSVTLRYIDYQCGGLTRNPTVYRFASDNVLAGRTFWRLPVKGFPRKIPKTPSLTEGRANDGCPRVLRPWYSGRAFRSGRARDTEKSIEASGHRGRKRYAPGRSAGIELNPRTMAMRRRCTPAGAR